jgi:hypothetical protein
MDTKEARKRGGEKTKKKYGIKHFKEIRKLPRKKNPTKPSHTKIN